MRHFGLDKALIKAHEHNEREAAEAILQRLKLGAGGLRQRCKHARCVSDPGARLVDAVSQAGFRCLPIPGASSAVTAMSVARRCAWRRGSASWVPAAKPRERESVLKKLADGSTLGAVRGAAPDRWFGGCPVRSRGRTASQFVPELTKQFEQVHTAMAETLPAWLAQDAHRAKGEFVVVVHASAPRTWHKSCRQRSRTLDLLCAELPLKQAVSLRLHHGAWPERAVRASLGAPTGIGTRRSLKEFSRSIGVAAGNGWSGWAPRSADGLVQRRSTGFAAPREAGSCPGRKPPRGRVLPAAAGP